MESLCRYNGISLPLKRNSSAGVVAKPQAEFPRDPVRFPKGKGEDSRPQSALTACGGPQPLIERLQGENVKPNIHPV
jgi:hypothetical protein